MRPRRAASNDPRRCENCEHFCPHYLLTDAPKPCYVACGAGHCIFPRIKLVHTNQVCDSFSPRHEKTRRP